jgi:hypothetical protein
MDMALIYNGSKNNIPFMELKRDDGSMHDESSKDAHHGHD